MFLIIDCMLDTGMKQICALYLIAIWSLLLYYMNWSSSYISKKKLWGSKAYEYDNASNINLNMISLPNKDE